MVKLSNVGLLVVLLSATAFGRQAFQGSCTKGGQVVILQGINSTTKVQASYPGCTVSVFNHGLATLATIFDDNGVSLANPFTASVLNGVFLFSAANGHYDVVLSGGTPNFPTPETITDILLNDPTASNTVTAVAFISASANPATSGVLQVASADTLACWKSNLGGSDLCFTKNPSDVVDLNAALTVHGPFSTSGNPLTASTITGTTGAFSGAITGASYSGGAISGTIGTFSGAVSAQGISSTTGTFSGAITGASYSGGSVSGTTGNFTDVNVSGTETVGLWNNIRVVDGVKFPTINAAENDCSTSNCIVIIPSSFPCGSGQSLASKDNITVWDFRQCSSPQSTAGHFFYSVKDTNNGALRDKMMVVDSFTPANVMSASSSSASFYTHTFLESNLASLFTLEAINGTITVDTGATNSPAVVVGIEGEASVSGTAANTLTDVRGGTFNVGLTGAGNIGTATALRAQTITNTGTGLISNAFGFVCEDQTVGTVSNLCFWSVGKSAFTKPVSFGDFLSGVIPQAAVMVFVRPLSGQLVGGSQIGEQVAPVCGSDATSQCEGLRSRFDTTAAAYTVPNGAAIHVTEGTKGAGSAITAETGLLIDALSNGGTNFAIQAANQIKNTLATGTAPFVITSTTPVANLTTVPTAYDHTGAQITAYHLVEDSCVLGTSCGVTLAGSSAYTNATSYTCTCQDDTAIAACKVAQTAGNGFTITGTGTDTIRYHCGGS